VKNYIGRQLIKNKNLLAFVVDTPTVEEEGFSEGARCNGTSPHFGFNCWG
jgi:hypothetical protein